MVLLPYVKRLPHALFWLVADIGYGVAWAAIMLLVVVTAAPKLYAHVKKEVPDLTVLAWVLGASGVVLTPLKEYVFYAPYEAWHYFMHGYPVVHAPPAK